MEMLDFFGEHLFRYVHERHLVYAACWEDPRVDREALSIGPDDHMLVITSAGCNVLDYLLEAPATITAVDLNYRQNALLDLKLAAIAELSWEDFFAIFGRGRHLQAASIYRDALRRRLAPLHQQFWDRHIRLFCGRVPFYFRTTSGWFASLIAWYLRRALGCDEAVQQLLSAKSLGEQRQIYDAHIRDRFWRPSLAFLLRRNGMLALSGIPPEQRRRILRDHPDLLAYLRQRAEHVIDHLPLAENYFWRVYLTGEFTTECCPRYLERENFARLKQVITRVEFACNSVEGHLQNSQRQYSRFVLLDHMDWLTGKRTPELAAEWQAIVDHASDDAMVLWRSLGDGRDYLSDVRVHRAGRTVPLDEVLDYNRPLAQQLRLRERANAYDSLHIATLRPR